MKLFIIFIVVLLFTVSWTILSHKFLPSEISDQANHQYDERQSKIFTEVLARTCVWTIHALLLTFIMRLINVWNFNHSFFSTYPELSILIIIFILTMMNYFYVKSKYT